MKPPFNINQKGRVLYSRDASTVDEALEDEAYWWTETTGAFLVGVALAIKAGWAPQGSFAWEELREEAQKQGYEDRTATETKWLVQNFFGIDGEGKVNPDDVWNAECFTAWSDEPLQPPK